VAASAAVENADEGWPTDAELDAVETAQLDEMRNSTPSELQAAGERDQSAAVVAVSDAAGDLEQEVNVCIAVDKPAQLSLRSSRELQGSPLNMSGFVWAVALLAAIRLSRVHAEMAPFKSRTKEINEEKLINDQQLFSSRRAYEQQVAAAQVVEREERLKKAREEAVVREQGRLARIKEREEMAAEAKKRAEAEAAARRKRFEEEEAASKAVLADRMEKERVARIEFERKRELDREKERREKAALEQQWREEEMRRAQAQRDKLAAMIAAEEQAEADAIVAAEQEWQQLWAHQAQRFTLQLTGSVSVLKPAQGTVTEERYPRQAVVKLSCTLSSAAAPGGAPLVERLYGDVDDAQADISEVASCAARAAVEASASAMQLPGSDELEEQHWKRFAIVRTFAVTKAAFARLITDSVQGGVRDRTAPVQVTTERLVLPGAA